MATIDRSLARIALTAVVLCATAPIGATLIHEYTFDSGPIAIDTAGTANGTLFGGAVISGGTLLLDGSTAYAETIGNHIVPLSGDLTVMLDAQQSAFGVSWVEMISQGDSGTGFYIGYDPSHFFRLSDAHLITSLAFPTDGRYHNYALTLAGSSLNFYIDGSLQGVFTGLARGPGGSDTRFGRQFHFYPEFFNGRIDNVRVYNTALSADEIRTIAQLPEPAMLALLGIGFVGLGCTRRPTNEVHACVPGRGRSFTDGARTTFRGEQS